MTQRQIIDKLHEHFGKSDTKSFAKGTIITQANRDPEGVSFIVDGIVEQYDITPEGNKVTVNLFKPGAFFPMSWAINKTPNTYFFAALTDAKLQQANTDQTVKFLIDNPDVLMNLLSRVYRGTDALLKRLVLAINGAATNRLIFELLIESYRFGNIIDDRSVQINISRNSLAARSGLARETVSRELHKLDKLGLIYLTKQKIIVRNDKLEQFLESI